MECQTLFVSVTAYMLKLCWYQYLFTFLFSGLVGLAISYALTVTSLLGGVINAFTETEREMIAVERVGEYIKQIEPEGLAPTNLSLLSAPYGWPNMGLVSFNEVVMKYR